jgi:MoaA/NifB/PqqE/SkfB family radical SAM enzyme
MNRNSEDKSYPDIIEESLSIEVTTHCNSDCPHCFSRAGNSERSSLPVELVKEIMAEGYHTAYRHLHITGGEPLLWRGVIEVLDNAFDLGYKSVFLNTNGALLTNDIAKRLTTYDGLSISVSLEGTEALHDHLRGHGSHKRTVQGIEKALDAGIDLFIFSTACRSLLSDLPYFADDLYRKFSAIGHLTLIQLFSVKGNGFTLSEELLRPEEFLQLVRMVALLNVFGYKTCFLNNPLASVASKLLKMPWIPLSRSLYRQGSMIVMANRDMCLAHSSKHSFGKYQFGMIEKVLTSDAYQRAVAPDETTCPGCKHTQLCMHYGMVRPTERCWEENSDMHYCKRVLDKIVA